MLKTELYKSSNELQRKDATRILDRYLGQMQWIPGARVLDIGCGPGDVTALELLPRLPTQISQVVGSDVSSTMLQHAAATHKNPKLEFRHLDIATPALPTAWIQSFDKVFTFYTLHWVQEQRQAVKNMHDLLKPGGEALIGFLAKCPIFHLYSVQSKKPEWREYMKNAQTFISPYQNSSDPAKEFAALLQEVGFEVIDCDCKENSYNYSSIHCLKDSITAVNPFLQHMPENIHEDYIRDCLIEAKKLKSADKNNNEDKDTTMLNAELYKTCHDLQRKDATRILDRYLGQMQWIPGARVLDIGCGPGDVTALELLPRLPAQISQVVGLDILTNMLQLAAATHKNPKLEFRHLDIATPALPTDLIQSFDKVFTFYTLHWVQEQRQAVKNMYDLLKPGGEALICFLAKCSIFQAYRIQSEKPEWREYMKNVQRFITPYQNSSDPAKEYTALLQEVGFEVIDCDCEESSYNYSSMHSFKDSMKAVNPFLQYMPENLHEDYIRDCIKEANKINSADNNNEEDKETTLRYHLMIAFVRKR